MWVFIEYLIIILLPLILIGLGFTFFRSQKKIKLQSELSTGKKATKKSPADYIIMIFGVVFLVILFFAIAYYFNPGP